MDYMTKPTSRETLRRLAPYARQLFGVPLTGAFPVLHALEKAGVLMREVNIHGSKSSE